MFVTAIMYTVGYQVPCTEKTLRSISEVLIKHSLSDKYDGTG